MSEVKTIKKQLLQFFSSNYFLHSIISLLFFLSWVNLFLQLSFYFLGGGVYIFFLLFPLILFAAVLQYKNKIAYAMVIMVFTSTLLTELFSMYFCIYMYFNSDIFSYTSPLSEIKQSTKLILIASVGILLMNRKSLLRRMNWSKKETLILLTSTLILFFIFHRFVLIP